MRHHLRPQLYFSAVSDQTNNRLEWTFFSVAKIGSTSRSDTILMLCTFRPLPCAERYFHCRTNQPILSDSGKWSIWKSQSQRCPSYIEKIDSNYKRRHKLHNRCNISYNTGALQTYTKWQSLMHTLCSWWFQIDVKLLVICSVYS